MPLTVAIELNEKIEYSYLHRAFGLYQVKRFSLASRDINKFYELDTNDPFRILWRYIINSQLDPQKALIELQNEPLGDSHYAWLFVDVVAGRLSEQELLANISKDIKTNKELAERLCEAYFYLAHWHKLAGHLDKAIYYFKLSTTTGIHEFIEYKYALMELASIQKDLVGNAEVKVN
ncbi:hypothetical protein ACLKMH_16860 [Psychromonas sp. KJ10-10]|uniref:hypothetical protein n=1 Tax=Psychromonas sp. KJ10-10 TaxID=3391823 RepID=UPI0039B4DA10